MLYFLRVCKGLPKHDFLTDYFSLYMALCCVQFTTSCLNYQCYYGNFWNLSSAITNNLLWASIRYVHAEGEGEKG